MKTALRIGSVLLVIFLVVEAYLFATSREMDILIPIYIGIIGVPFFILYFLLLFSYKWNRKIFLGTLVLLGVTVVGFLIWEGIESYQFAKQERAARDFSKAVQLTSGSEHRFTFSPEESYQKYVVTAKEKGDLLLTVDAARKIFSRFEVLDEQAQPHKKAVELDERRVLLQNVQAGETFHLRLFIRSNEINTSASGTLKITQTNAYKPKHAGDQLLVIGGEITNVPEPTDPDFLTYTIPVDQEGILQVHVHAHMDYVKTPITLVDEHDQPLKGVKVTQKSALTTTHELPVKIGDTVRILVNQRHSKAQKDFYTINCVMKREELEEEDE